MTTEEMKYFERLNIGVLSIAKIKNLIRSNILNTMNCWEKDIDIQKQTFHIIGPAGVGKTEICQQLCDELTMTTGKDFGNITIKCPVLSRDDFLIPFPVVNGEDMSFKMLYSDFIPKNKDSFGLFVIDEFSRGDHSLQQLMWQVQNEFKLHLMDFPRGWFVIAIDNPDDQEYTMDTMEDAAGLRRMLHIYTEVSAPDFLNYAIGNNFHPIIIEFIQAHPDYLYDFQAQKVGSVFANPASYEKMSNILWGYDNDGGIANNYGDIEQLAAGLLNVSKTRLLIEFMKDKKDINPKDILFKYTKVRKRVQHMVKEGDNATLGSLMVGFCTYLSTSRPDYKDKDLNNIADFLTDVPIDTAAIFVSQIDNFQRTSEEFKYVTTIHGKLMKSSSIYKKKFYEAIVEVGKD